MVTGKDLARVLSANGIASVDAKAVWDATEWPTLHDLDAGGREWLERCRAKPESFRSGYKPFLRVSRDRLTPSHPIVKLMPAVREVAETYTGEPMLWYASAYWVILPTVGPEVYSQKWHRDPEVGAGIVKVFYHVDAVTEDNGPFEYVRGTHRSQHLEWCPRQRYKTDDGEIPASEVESCRAPAGGVVIADTSGIHRGGRIAAGHRLQAVWEFIPVRGASNRMPVRVRPDLR
jgi:hypothetical protein